MATLHYDVEKKINFDHGRFPFFSSSVKMIESQTTTAEADDARKPAAVSQLWYETSYSPLSRCCC